MSSRRKSTRRQFLKGRAAADALGDLLQGADGEADRIEGDVVPAPGKPDQQTYLLEITRRAMACQFTVFLNAGQCPDGTEQAVEALDLVEQLEDQMTVYRDHSEIAQISQHASRGPVRVEPRLFGLLSHAVEIHQLTEGAFDITAGPLAKVWGFCRREGQLPDERELEKAIQRVGSQWLTLSDRDMTIRFEKPEMELNLGGIGKGYALDRVAESLKAASVEGFLIHGGQSSVLARGSRARGESDQAGWSVGVRHPLRPDRRLAEIRLHDRALGTSGTGTQYFHHKGKRYGHILDPRTGQPAEGTLQATALTPRAATADALSTAFYVMGLDTTRQYCHQHPEVAAVIVRPAQRSGAIEVHAFNLPSDLWQCTQEVVEGHS